MTGSLVVLAACGEAAPSGPGSADFSTERTTTAVASAAPSPAASPPASEPAAATGTAAVSGLRGATLYGVTGRDAGVVAVGSADEFAAGWTSADGQVWQPAWVASDGGPARFRAVAAGDDGLVAFAGADDSASTVWTSDDGGAWAPVEASGIEGRINAVAFHDGQWFAVGDLIDTEGGEAVGGAVYVSDDGSSWSVLTDELLVGEATVSDVVGGDGGLVIVGFDVDGGTVWLDTEPRREPITDGFEGSTIQGVAVTDDGFVALGRGVADLRPVAWTSPDGRSWERTDLDADVFGPSEQIHDLTTTADGRLLAVGATDDGGMVWTSADGVTWARGG
ncbi:MAG: hypothetical protein KY460_06825 [Actinobacteria bacterium]|nr:hypothetical protein [Actinomycetota bacterium]